MIAAGLDRGDAPVAGHPRAGAEDRLQPGGVLFPLSVPTECRRGRRELGGGHCFFSWPRPRAWAYSASTASSETRVSLQKRLGHASPIRTGGNGMTAQPATPSLDTVTDERGNQLE